MQQNHPQFALEHKSSIDHVLAQVDFFSSSSSRGFLSGFSSVDFYPCGRSRAAGPLASWERVGAPRRAGRRIASKVDFSLAPKFSGRKYDVLKKKEKSVKEPIMKLVTTLHSNFHVIFVTIVLLLPYAQSQLESNVNTLRYDGEVNIGKADFMYPHFLLVQISYLLKK